MNISLILPTFNEKKNLPILIPLIFKYMPDIEIIIIDDNSPDGTGKLAKELSKKYNLKVIHRKRRLGLSTAIVLGFKHAKGDIIGAMDADLSHPPRLIPKMVACLKKNNADLVIASRKLKKSRVEGWPFHRRIMSDIASILAGFLTDVNDPLSGYFFMRKQVIKNIKFKSKGYKILLEILKKGKYSKVTEIAYVFRGREFGSSKLGFKENFMFLIDYYKLVK